MTDLGVTVAKYRGFRGYSQETLATKVGIARGAIAQIELGQIAWPRLDTLQKIAVALCVPLETLLREGGIIAIAANQERVDMVALINSCPDLLALFVLVREHTGQLPEILRVVRAMVGVSLPPE